MPDFWDDDYFLTVLDTRTEFIDQMTVVDSASLESIITLQHGVGVSGHGGISNAVFFAEQVYHVSLWVHLPDFLGREPFLSVIRI